MTFCKICGKELLDGSTVCPYCGASTTETAQQDSPLTSNGAQGKPNFNTQAPIYNQQQQNPYSQQPTYTQPQQNPYPPQSPYTQQPNNFYPPQTMYPQSQNPYPPYYQQPMYPQASIKNNGFALAGFIVSLSSLLVNFMGVVGFVGFILSIIGLIQLTKQNPATQKGKGFAITGIVIGAISILYGFVQFLYLISGYSYIY